MFRHAATASCSQRSPGPSLATLLPMGIWSSGWWVRFSRAPRLPPLVTSTRWRGRCIDHHPGPHLLQALGNYALTLGQSVRDHIVALLLAADGDALDLHLALGVDLEDVAAGLID